MAAAAAGIKLSSPGPVLYRARRVGRGGRSFTMLKLRTMDHGGARGSAVTPGRDPRVFPLGALLRDSKLDDLPQLFNVLVGEMSMVGPRPEDPRIVRDHYADEHREVQRVRPGLTGVGSLYQWAHLDELVDEGDPEGSYARRLMPTKIALEMAYLRAPSVRAYLGTVGRTGALVGARALGLVPPAWLWGKWVRGDA
jgi:lipopolysaccharide/colanic/teichoic acid biosynthesis glycosyltransferase